MTFKRERLASAATDEMLAAVDVADMLVKRGVPFRQSHGDRRRARAHGGRIGPRALRSSRREELREHSDVLDDDFYSVLSQGSWLESKESEGGTSLTRVREQLAHANGRRCDIADVLRRCGRSTTGRCSRWRRPCSAASSSSRAAPA